MVYLRATSFVVAALFLALTVGSVVKSSDPQEVQDVLPRDAIRALDGSEQRFGEAASGEANQLVLGVARDREARAYPISVLTFHEIVNDVVGGVPIAATYCPLCAAGIVFDRRVDGMTLDFVVSGKLWKNNLVMSDEQTKSLWPQIQGEAIEGPLEGRQLRVVDSDLVAWSLFKEAHPNATVMQPPGGVGYAGDPYAGYEDREGALFPIAHYDRALFTKDLVYGIEHEGLARAYPVRELGVAGVLQEQWAGLDVVAAYWAGAASFWHAENKTFEDVDERRMRSDDGLHWFKATGQAVDPETGNLSGERLERIPAVPSYWFAWKDFHPETTIYNATSQPSSQAVWERVTLANSQLMILMLIGAVFVLWVTGGAVRRRVKGTEEPEPDWHALRPWMGLAYVALGVLFLSFALGSTQTANAVVLGVPAVALAAVGAWRIAEAFWTRGYEVRFGPLNADSWKERVVREEDVVAGPWPSGAQIGPWRAGWRGQTRTSGTVWLADGVLIRRRPDDGTASPAPPDRMPERADHEGRVPPETGVPGRRGPQPEAERRPRP